MVVITRIEFDEQTLRDVASSVHFVVMVTALRPRPRVLATKRWSI